MHQVFNIFASKIYLRKIEISYFFYLRIQCHCSILINWLELFGSPITIIPKFYRKHGGTHVAYVYTNTTDILQNQDDTFVSYVHMDKHRNPIKIMIMICL